MRGLLSALLRRNRSYNLHHHHHHHYIQHHRTLARADDGPLCATWRYLECSRSSTSLTRNFTASAAVGGFLRSLNFSLHRNAFRPQRFVSWPHGSWRYFTATPDGVVLGLIGANVAVFLLWKMADYKFMYKNFMISLENVKSGRLHTLITSAFSHADTDHIFTNMIGLYFFGMNIARLFGPSFLLKLYLAGALGGSVFYLMHKAYISSSLKGPQGRYYSRMPALGASAAVNAIILLDVFLFPTSTMYLYFMVPVPAALVGAFIIGSDLWRMQKGHTNVSGSAHLGGAVVAAIAWAGLKKGLI